MENKLHVQDLRVSFHTSNGKVQAVRGINFDLAKGETLAIVGESGSGKSVTSKAILGILAGNSIVESGEIIYDGQDLLKISEEDFHKIRGDKIAMIFQDPMSSLNPIVRIGNQLTEAMILKGKIRQKESRNNFNGYLKVLNAKMVEACGDKSREAELTETCKKFDKFEIEHTKLEAAYNIAHEGAEEALDDIEVIAFELEKNAPGKGAADRLKDIERYAKSSLHKYVVDPEVYRAEVEELAGSLSGKFKDKDYQGLLKSLYRLKEILSTGMGKGAPNFFRMGYYVTFSGQELPDMPIDELNEYLLKYLDDNFMLEFLRDAEQALAYSAGITYGNIRTAIGELEKARAAFAREKLDKKECQATAKHLGEVVKNTIDPLAITKDSVVYTFLPGLKSELESYFGGVTGNVRILRKYEKEKRKYDALVAKGKKPGWELADAAVTDLELVKANISHLIDRLSAHYEQVLSASENRDYRTETIAVIDYLMANASGVVAKVTPQIAKQRAIKLMEEVGIAEPHKRYRQYPFEFSGGMRQRIVIAIALAANPDILICDEPTTALDVTIQSQILELINKLQKERQLSVIFITHDLGVVANMADRVAVMYAGKIVEYGTAEDIFYHAAHPYTWALMSSMPDLDTNEKLSAIPGTPPNMIYPPKGDAFAPRNKYAMKIDFERQPPMFQISDTHYAATWLLHPDAPKVDPPKAVMDRIARMNERRKSNDEQPGTSA